MRTVGRRAAFGAAVGLLSLLLVQSASALMVTYEWVPGTNSPTPNGGVGTITLNSAAITDGANFTGIAAGALVSFSYLWNNGATFNSSMPFSPAVSAPGWSASGGFLTTVFTLGTTIAGVGSFGISGQPYNPVFPGFGTSSNNTNTLQFGAEIDAGNWRLQSVSAVPLPAAVWLLASGLAGLAGLRRRRGNTAA